MQIFYLKKKNNKDWALKWISIFIKYYYSHITTTHMINTCLILFANPRQKKKKISFSLQRSKKIHQFKDTIFFTHLWNWYIVISVNKSDIINWSNKINISLIRTYYSTIMKKMVKKYLCTRFTREKKRWKPNCFSIVYFLIRIYKLLSFHSI